MEIRSIYFFIIFILFVSGCSGIQSENKQSLENSRKKILIYMSKGGASHISGSNAIKSYLDDKYEIAIVNFFEEIMSSVDLLRWITFGAYSGEDFYNACLRYRLTSVANGFATLGSWGISCFSKTIESFCAKHITSYKPDLIISVIPFVNGPIYNAAKKMAIPFIVVTNDLDTTHYAYGLSNPNFEKFFYTLAFDEPSLREKIAFAKIPQDKIKITGFPLRAEFFHKNKDKLAIKKEFAIPGNKKVIMILMGGAGSNSSLTYTKQLLKIKHPVHAIICLGRNEQLRNQIEKLELPSNISLTILGFTNRIADLMSISDLLITKSGPGSLCEAIVTNLPVIIDKTFRTLWWEQITVDLVEKYNLGAVARKFRDLPNIVDQFLSDDKIAQQIKNNMEALRKNKTFGENLKVLVDEILAN